MMRTELDTPDAAYTSEETYHEHEKDKFQRVYCSIVILNGDLEDIHDVTTSSEIIMLRGRQIISFLHDQNAIISIR